LDKFTINLANKQGNIIYHIHFTQTF